jgi:hypothetical protein
MGISSQNNNLDTRIEQARTEMINSGRGSICKNSIDLLVETKEKTIHASYEISPVALFKRQCVMKLRIGKRDIAPGVTLITDRLACFCYSSMLAVSMLPSPGGRGA